MRISPAFDAEVAYLYDGVLGPYWPPERAHVDAGYATITMPFAPMHVPAFAMRARWTLAQVLAYLQTWSALQRMRKATGTDPLESARAALVAAWGDAGERDVEWPLVLVAGRA